VLELDTYFRFLMALGFVLALIGAGAWAIKRFALERGLPKGQRTARRLQVVETLSLDTRRKLVLLRRDGTEHLVLFGANQELLVESGIERTAEPATTLGEAARPAGASQAARLVPIAADRGPIRDRR
jgi:flagellar protein FliO/FliZ